MINDAEEIRIRALIAGRTGNSDLIKTINPMFAFAGLYPERMRQMDSNGNYIGKEEILTEEFRNKIEKWPDVKEAVEKHLLTRGVGGNKIGGPSTFKVASKFKISGERRILVLTGDLDSVVVSNGDIIEFEGAEYVINSVELVRGPVSMGLLIKCSDDKELELFKSFDWEGKIITIKNL